MIAFTTTWSLTIAAALSLGTNSGGAAVADTGRAVHTSLEEVHACAPTDDGVLAGTLGGLALVGFDGTVAKTWTSIDGLPGTRVHAIVADDKGWWIGTEGGAARVTLAGDTLTIGRTVETEPVRDLLVSGGRLYIGTWGGGVYRASLTGKARAKKLRFAGRVNKRAQRVTALAEHKRTIFAATAGNGVFTVKGNSLRRAQTVSARTFAWSMQSVRGELLIGTVDGLLSLGANGPAERIGQSDIRELAKLDGKVIAGTFGEGARSYRAGHLLGAKGLPAKANFLHSIGSNGDAACLGGHDGLWTRKSKSSTWRKADLRDGPPSNDIAALAVAGDRLWVGSFDRGLGYYEAGTWHRMNDRAIDAKINGLAVEKTGRGHRVWVATSAGLARIDGDKVRHYGEADGFQSRHLLSLTTLKDGGVLAGTTRGAVIVKGDEVTTIDRKSGTATGNVWSVAQDADGYLWLGTTKGIYRGKIGEEWIHMDVATKHLRDDWVMAIETSGRTAHLGTYKGGVTKASWTEAAPTEVTIEHHDGGWINPSGLTRVGKTLYAATMDGLLSKTDTSDWKKRVVTPGRDTTAIAQQGNSVWIASRRGLVRISRD
jgi:ligand-binding sensor domain-containing protein